MNNETPTTRWLTLDEQHQKLLFTSQRMVRYHRHREHFLDRIHYIGAFLTVLTASGTMATALADLYQAVILFALTTALVTGHELIHQTARKARIHNTLARNWIDFEKRVRRAQPGLTKEKLTNLQCAHLQMEVNAPPSLQVLTAICHNEIVTAVSGPETERSAITFMQRILANLIDYRPGLIRKQTSPDH